MAGDSEAKWFVYIKDHAEGPLTVDQLKAAIRGGKILTAHYAWKRGMKDWEPLHKIDELSVLSREVAAPTEAERSPPVGEITDLMRKSSDTQDDRSDWIKPPDHKRATEEASRISNVVDREATVRVTQLLKVEAQATLASGIKRALGVVGILLIFAVVWLTLTRDRMDSPLRTVAANLGLSSLISPIPGLQEFSPEDLSELRGAALSGNTALAMTWADKPTPHFWVAGGKPDGTVVQIDILGVPDTLVGKAEFKATLSGTVKRHMVLISSSGNSNVVFVPGLYRVHVVGGPSTEVFLGGHRDAAYRTALQDWHSSIHSSLTAVYNELLSILDLADQQLVESKNLYELYTKNKNIGKVKVKTETLKKNLLDRSTQMMGLVDHLSSLRTPTMEQFSASALEVAHKTLSEVFKVSEFCSAMTGLEKGTPRPLFETVLQDTNALRVRVKTALNGLQTHSGLPAEF